MSQETLANAEGVDFALVAYREEGVWQVRELDEAKAGSDLDGFARSCAASPVTPARSAWCPSTRTSSCWSGCSAPRPGILLSDVTAATDWPIARSVVDQLELPLPDDEEEQEPAGDLDIVADLGLGAMDMGALLDDVDLYPDEMLGDIAAKLGFGALYDDAVGVRPVTSSMTPGSGPRPWGGPRRGACGAGHVRRTHRGGGARRGRRRRRPGPQPAGGGRRPHRARRGGRAPRGGGRRGEWRLGGCTLVVTLEPCTMCAGAVVLSRVDRLVFAAFDEKAGAVGSLWDVVRDRRLNHRPEVVSGVRADESTDLLRTFFAR